MDEPVRLVGLGVSNLVDRYNLDLFEKREKKDALFEVVDKIRLVKGRGSVNYGV